LYKFFLILLLLIKLNADDEYKLGQGMQLGSLPMYVGGYFSIDYTKQDDMTRYRLDDIAFLSYGHYEKFSYMLEAEFKDLYAYIIDEHKDSYTQKNENLFLERLYVDYNHNENYMFRFGKFNSPIGFWNLLPVNVLRDTTSSPISSSILFPVFTTGVNLEYSSFEESQIQVDIVIQRNEGIDDRYNNYNINKHLGLGITYEKEDYSFKVNGGFFHRHEDAILESDSYYLLLSLKYETDRYKLLSEIGSQYGEKDFVTKYAGYVQSSYNFLEKHSAILRIESLDDVANDMKDTIGVLGYTYRPLYPVALKSEVQLHSYHNENKFLCSLSVLF
jgi:hypothetical protein